uniref:Uncharacterized protein n=1 Tax=Rhizophora mucronata TaxID=61149 RepID=A0A2P2JGC2_RHIMU
MGYHRGFRTTGAHPYRTTNQIRQVSETGQPKPSLARRHRRRTASELSGQPPRGVRARKWRP